jgi:hypothetical protein
MRVLSSTPIALLGNRPSFDLGRPGHGLNILSYARKIITDMSYLISTRSQLPVNQISVTSSILSSTTSRHSCIEEEIMPGHTSKEIADGTVKNCFVLNFLPEALPCSNASRSSSQTHILSYVPSFPATQHLIITRPSLHTSTRSSHSQPDTPQTSSQTP